MLFAVIARPVDSLLPDTNCFKERQFELVSPYYEPWIGKAQNFLWCLLPWSVLFLLHKRCKFWCFAWKEVSTDLYVNYRLDNTKRFLFTLDPKCQTFHYGWPVKPTMMSMSDSVILDLLGKSQMKASRSGCKREKTFFGVLSNFVDITKTLTSTTAAVAFIAVKKRRYCALSLIPLLLHDMLKVSKRSGIKLLWTDSRLFELTRTLWHAITFTNYGWLDRHILYT